MVTFCLPVPGVHVSGPQSPISLHTFRNETGFIPQSAAWAAKWYPASQNAAVQAQRAHASSLAQTLMDRCVSAASNQTGGIAGIVGDSEPQKRGDRESAVFIVLILYPQRGSTLSPAATDMCADTAALPVPGCAILVWRQAGACQLWPTVCLLSPILRREQTCRRGNAASREAMPAPTRICVLGFVEWRGQFR